MTHDTTIHDSSGNIFADMGLPDADERLARAEMMLAVQDRLRERGLTQTQAAALLGVTQPDVSDLMHGRLARFSRARLERFVNALDRVPEEKT